MKRAGVFVFYDKNGKVNRYIPYLLDGIKPLLDRLVIVVNGAINDEGRNILESYSEELIQRDNEGFDTWGYKTGMDYFGWDCISEMDELVIFNDTVMGPVFPFSEMFDEMDARKLDFWGITRHYKDMANPYNCEYGYIPAHIQSYFCVFGNRMLKSEAFQNYWDNLFEIRSYEDAVGKHEIVFTKKFEDMGFTWGTYVDAKELEHRHSQPLMAYPELLVRKYRCPIFKKRVFFQDYNWVINTNVGQEAQTLYHYLEEKTDYPVDYIVEALYGVRNLRELYRNFHWNRVLDDIPREKLTTKAALVVMQSYKDSEGEIEQYLSNLPEYVTIIRVDGKNYRAGLRRVLEIGNKYDVVGFLHDSDFVSSPHTTIDEGTFYKEAQNLFVSRGYIENIFSLFREEKKLGLVVAPEMQHAIFVDNPGSGWRDYFVKAKDISTRLNLTVPISEDVVPMMVPDLMFWARGTAISAVSEKMKFVLSNGDDHGIQTPAEEYNGWNYDFTYHLLERMLPYFMQQEGYLYYQVCNAKWMETEIDNIRYQLGEHYNLNNFYHAKSDTLAMEKNALQDEVNRLNQKFNGAVEYYEGSRSWKLTKPVRAIKGFVDRVRGKESLKLPSEWN